MDKKSTILILIAAAIALYLIFKKSAATAAATATPVGTLASPGAASVPFFATPTPGSNQAMSAAATQAAATVAANAGPPLTGVNLLDPNNGYVQQTDPGGGVDLLDPNNGYVQDPNIVDLTDLPLTGEPAPGLAAAIDDSSNLSDLTALPLTGE